MTNDETRTPRFTRRAPLRSSLGLRASGFLGQFVIFFAATLQAESFVPDFKLKPDDYTVLMAVDAKLSDGLKPFQQGGHGKFYVQGWQRSDQQAEWTISAQETADYTVQALIHRNGNQPLRLDVALGGTTLSGTLPADSRRWQRVALAGTAGIPAGETHVSLQLSAVDGSPAFDVQVHAIELVRPAVRDRLHRTALAMRADATWFQKARFGIMVHWTKESMPLRGAQKSYEEAVDAFDAEAFADTMKQTGAGFVLLTTSHAFQYFPAPLAALDTILPRRTTKRDLVADLAGALGRRGMKLMLYYHLGARNDPAWLNASGFWETDTTRFFDNWRAIISEAGRRYGDKLAGWWFDDGSVTYYYRSAPWERLDRAAKAGFPQRLVAFNSWELNSPTEFQDYFTGEGFQDPRGYNELLKSGGNGRYPSGTHQGLQASACLIADMGSWVHTSRDTPPSGPRWNALQMKSLINSFISYRNVPIFNLEITQDGVISPQSIAVFKQATARHAPIH